MKYNVGITLKGLSQEQAEAIAKTIALTVDVNVNPLGEQHTPAIYGAEAEVFSIEVDVEATRRDMFR